MVNRFLFFSVCAFIVHLMHFVVVEVAVAPYDLIAIN